jgi:dTDP-glucose 4,6-dehydratase
VKILLTGGAGFIGHHAVDFILKNTDHDLVLLDRLDCSGNLNRLTDLKAWDSARCRVVHHDLRAPINAAVSKKIGNIDVVLHMAAGSHVDRSIEHPMEFVLDNVVGTCNLLDWCRDSRPDQILYFSTDEVFGPAPKGTFYDEWARYKSGNPYAATKAGAEELALAYQNTYDLNVIITHTMNVIGERQHPEKFFPSTVAKVKRGETVIIHADKTCTIPGSRHYIHARNVAAATMFVLENGASGEKYNIVGEKELDNLTLAQMIADAVGKPLKYELVDFHSQRPGHDLRYALDGTRLKVMGWAHPSTIEDDIKNTTHWYLENLQWN